MTLFNFFLNRMTENIASRSSIFWLLFWYLVESQLIHLINIQNMRQLRAQILKASYNYNEN